MFKKLTEKLVIAAVLMFGGGKHKGRGSQNYSSRMSQCNRIL